MNNVIQGPWKPKEPAPEIDERGAYGSAGEFGAIVEAFRLAAARAEKANADGDPATPDYSGRHNPQDIDTDP